MRCKENYREMTPIGGWSGKLSYLKVATVDFQRIGRFFLVVAMSVYIYIYISVPFSCNFFASKNWCGASLVHGLMQCIRRPRMEP